MFLFAVADGTQWLPYWAQFLLLIARNLDAPHRHRQLARRRPGQRPPARPRAALIATDAVRSLVLASLAVAAFTGRSVGGMVVVVVDIALQTLAMPNLLQVFAVSARTRRNSTWRT